MVLSTILVPFDTLKMSGRLQRFSQPVIYAKFSKMKRFLTLLILIFNYQSLIKADDIRDFELEGLSIGDNLTEYMTINEIINNDHRHYPVDSKFYEVAYSGNLTQYEYVNLAIKRNDDNFKIYFISF